MVASENADDGGPRQLAHDLLQSVAIVQSVVGALRAGEVPPGRLSEGLDMVGAEVDVMAVRLAQILDGPDAPLPFDLGDLAEQVVARVGPAYTGQIDIETESFSLVGDRLEWERALLNLIENACRAAGSNGKVVIRCRRTPEAGRVEVGDDGPGFGEGRVGRSSIGLAVVTRLVDALGGHLELRRSHLGGALIAIVVPASELVAPTA